jgi:hypothetical protein
VEPFKVPQHLDLQDVIAWGLGAVDLLCVVGTLTVGWWLYLALPGDPVPRIVVVAPLALAGLACGVVRSGDRALREWLAIGLAFALRSRVLVID